MTMVTPLPVALVELIRPADQGMSRPYLGRGEDDALYYIKGRQTDRHSIWSEWICAHLANAFGLRLPPFCLVHVSETLLDEAPHHPTAGWCCRSADPHCEPTSQTPARPTVAASSPSLPRWVQTNGHPVVAASQMPGPHRDYASPELVVIDHNRAFEPEFDAAFFVEHHVFAGSINGLHDLAVQAHYATRLAALLPVFDTACDNAPPEWRWANAEQDVSANFDPLSARAQLAQCLNPDFWRMV